MRLEICVLCKFSVAHLTRKCLFTATFIEHMSLKGVFVLVRFTTCCWAHKSSIAICNCRRQVNKCMISSNTFILFNYFNMNYIINIKCIYYKHVITNASNTTSIYYIKLHTSSKVSCCL